MEESLENTLRLSFFVGTLSVFAILELIFPRRALLFNKNKRWLFNLTIGVINAVLLKVIFPMTAVAFALYCHNQDWGLFNLYDTHPAVSIVTSVILLDLIIYWQHRLFHKFDIFWLLHRFHHQDKDLDASSALRFHPVEIALSYCIKFAFIGLLGIPGIAIIIFEIILSSMAICNHANLKLPNTLDYALRFLFVTPDMHRIHHSCKPEEMNSNYGFNLSLWDRLFNSYTQQPELPHTEMCIGLQPHNGE